MTKRNKKAITFTFVNAPQWVSAIVGYVQDYDQALHEYASAKKVRDEAKANLKRTVIEAAQAGFTIEARASKGTFAAAIYAGLVEAGYSDKTASNTLTSLRELTEVKNTGKRGKKSSTEAGPVSGFTMHLNTGIKPDVVKNKVLALAEYLRAEYKDDHMLKLAAFLADISEE